jgi:hypothetical protein
MDLLAERETVVTATVLERSGIPYRVLKGPAWAHSSYPDPMLRSFGDVDVLVPAKQWEQSVQALEASGAERLFPELRPGFDVRFGKDATYVAASGWEIDLHRTLAVGPYGFWIDSEALFARPAAEISLGGCDLPVLDPVAAYLHACYNAVLGDDPPRLPALRDVAQMGNEGSLDPDEVWSLAAGWRAVNVVRRALLLVSDRLGPDLTGAVAKRFAGEVSGFDRLLLASYRGAGRGYTAQLAGAVALRGWRSRWAYLSALARPQDSYLAARGFSLKGFVRYGLRKARRSV